MIVDSSTLTRIESTTQALPSAVRSTSGADFALLISLIDHYQSNSQSGFDLSASEAAQSAERGGFALPKAVTYPDPNQYHTAEAVERLNASVHSQNHGDFAYLNSLINTLSERGQPDPSAAIFKADPFAKSALEASGALMLDQITLSHSL
jgi:hypothetical protein